MEKVDIAIAGAGIAGCHAARDLARAGHSVVIVEKQPREKLGHDWWDAIQESTFAEVGLPAPEPPERMNPSGAATVITPLETLALDVPARPTVLHVDRKLFAKRQLKYAEEAGARLLDETAVAGPVLEDGKVVGITTLSKDGEKREIRAKLVIDASGMAAGIRNRMSEEYGFQKCVEREGTFVTHREIRTNTSNNHGARLYFGKNNGVCWINREQDGFVDFFAGFINLPGRPDPKETVRELIQGDGKCGIKRERAGYGAPIPVRHCFDSFVAPGFMLCGDSGCQCNPLDGSGMASSLKAATIAAAVAHEALEDGSLDIHALWHYNARYKHSQGKKFVPLDALQKFMVAEPKINLETLFRRRILRTEDFWGTGEIEENPKIEQLLQLLKLIDRPLFVIRLIRAMATANELSKHYADYPEKFDGNKFNSWRAKKRQLFARLGK